MQEMNALCNKGVFMINDTNSKRIKKLVIMSMLIALEIVLNRFLSINTIGTKIGFSFVPIVIAAFLFGPLSAAVVYGIADLLGALLFPIGPYFPGFTVCAFLMGLTYGFFIYKKPKISLIWNVLPPILINNLIFGLLINTVWVSILYNSKTYLGWFIYRLPEYAILIPVSFVLIPVTVKFSKIIKKAV
jgi:ECF transporter S component (folate family)